MKYSFVFLSIFIFPLSFLNAQVNRSGFIKFAPVSFSNKFSLNVTPALHIHSGDTVSTETIDAMGRDKNGVKRQAGGNPLTGPFFIEDAKPGDVLKITLIKVSLNRNYAFTSESFVSRSLPDSITRQFKKSRLIKWRLDIENGIGYPDSPVNTYQNLKDFKVPLKPFLGCIGVAPLNKHNEILSFFPGKLWRQP
jgi:acetamidase/formamidase